jgi:hypothetical protein
MVGTEVNISPQNTIISKKKIIHLSRKIIHLLIIRQLRRTPKKPHSKKWAVRGFSSVSFYLPLSVYTGPFLLLHFVRFAVFRRGSTVLSLEGTAQRSGVGISAYARQLTYPAIGANQFTGDMLYLPFAYPSGE